MACCGCVTYPQSDPTSFAPFSHHWLNKVPKSHPCTTRRASITRSPYSSHSIPSGVERRSFVITHSHTPLASHQRPISARNQHDRSSLIGLHSPPPSAFHPSQTSMKTPHHRRSLTSLHSHPPSAFHPSQPSMKTPHHKRSLTSLHSHPPSSFHPIHPSYPAWKQHRNTTSPCPITSTPPSNPPLSPLRYTPHPQNPPPRTIPHASSSSQAAAAVQPHNRQDTKDAYPTFLERLAAALMFLLPYSECMYRLALLFVGFCRHSSLDLLVWCRVQYNTVSSALAEVGGAASQQVVQELQACQMAMSWCQVLYTHFNTIAAQLTDLSQQTLSSWSFTALQQPLGQWASRTFSTPFSLWDLSCIAYMVLLAQAALTQLEAVKKAAKKDKGKDNNSQETKPPNPVPRPSKSRSSSSSPPPLPPILTSLLPTLLTSPSSSPSLPSPSLTLPFRLRRPDLLMVSFACAFLLRISCVPLVAVSGVAPDLYQPAMVLLTAATAFISLAAISRLLLDRLTPLEEVMTELVRGVLGLTVWHRTLLLMDWILMFFGPATGFFKVQVTACFVCYLLVLERLTNVAQEYVHKVAV